MRSDREIRDLKIHRMSEEDRSIEAKKEQARLSKHIVCSIHLFMWSLVLKRFF